MATVRIINPDKEDRKYRAIAGTLFFVGILGVSYLVYEYVQVMNWSSLPPGSDDLGQVLAEWKQEGLVRSFDVEKSELVVEERGWERRKPAEKVGIMTRLARYCAEEKQSDQWSLRVVGSRSLTVLGKIDQSGLHVN